MSEDIERKATDVIFTAIENVPPMPMPRNQMIVESLNFWLFLQRDTLYVHVADAAAPEGFRQFCVFPSVLASALAKANGKRAYYSDMPSRVDGPFRAGFPSSAYRVAPNVDPATGTWRCECGAVTNCGSRCPDCSGP
jgi:hypothetical protein